MKKIIVMIMLLVCISSVSAINVKWMYEEDDNVRYWQNILINYYTSVYDAEDYVPLIRIHKKVIQGKYCGLSHFSGVIDISAHSSCFFEGVLEHEIRHSLFWSLHHTSQKYICEVYGYDRIIRDCWETFAEL